MVIYKQLILLFGLMIIGFIAYKTKIMDDVSNKKISKFIVNIALPATIINSAIGQKFENPTSYIMVFLIWVAFYVLCPLVTFLICKIFRYDKTMELMLTYANIGFMGLPIVAAIWGDEYLIYVVLGMMCFNLSLFSYGVYVLQKQKAGNGKAKISIAKVLKSCLSPSLIGAVIAIFILFLQIPVPDVIGNIFSTVGATTIPLAMITIGSTLGNISFREMLADKRLYVFSVLKLLVYPAIMLALMLPFKKLIGDTNIIGLFVMLTSLPTAGNVSMIISEYDGDLPLVSKGTCIATLFCVGTIPLWTLILDKIF